MNTIPGFCHQCAGTGKVVSGPLYKMFCHCATGRMVAQLHAANTASKAANNASQVPAGPPHMPSTPTPQMPWMPGPLPVPMGPQNWVLNDFGAEPAVPPEAKAEPKLPPMNCVRCNHRNEYVGKEHLDEDGSYTCRTCK